MSRNEQNKKRRHKDLEGNPTLTLFVFVCGVLLLLPLFAVLPWLEIRTVIGLGEILLAAVTLIYVYIATGQLIALNRQWAAMQRGLRMTRQSNRLTLRAWVIVVHFRSEWTEPTHIFEAKLINNGKVPASGHSEVYSEVIRGPFPTFPLPDKPPQSNMAFHLGPNAEGHLAHRLPELDKVDKEDIGLGLATLVYVLRLNYTDVLGSRGFTRINAFHNPPTGHLNAGPDGNVIR